MTIVRLNVTTLLDKNKPKNIINTGEETEWSIRHTPMIRVMHWLNVICFTILLMSGLNIFNSNSMLFWGKSSYNGTEPLLKIKAQQSQQGNLIGVTTIFGHAFNTSGLLGLSTVDGVITQRAFPSWLTIPDTKWLALARLWHFFFAWLLVINGLMYVAYSFISRHLARDLTPTKKDWRGIGQSIKDHIKLKHPKGEAAKHYNILQKLAYLIVIFVLLPMLILMGLAMSPMSDSIITGWVDIVGGRQSARTLHFVAAFALVAFIFIHVFEVIISGLWNNMRSMITGRYRIELDATDKNEGAL